MSINKQKRCPGLVDRIGAALVFSYAGLSDMGPEEGALVVVAAVGNFAAAVQMEAVADLLLLLFAVDLQHALHTLAPQLPV